MRRAVVIGLVALAGGARAESTDGGRPIELFPSRLPPVDVQPPSLADAAGVARVESGQVPAAWRQAERAIGDAFHPPPASVAMGSAARALAEQALSNPAEGPPRTRNEPPPEAKRGEILLDDQVEATHQATRRARHWRNVEVEARLDENGKLTSLRVTLPSEDARLDQAALAAVAQALGHHPISGHDARYAARFRISAARSVTPLDLAPVTDPLTRSRLRGLVPKMRFHFDETTGKMETEKPFSQKIETNVKLISLTPQ